MSWNDLPVPDEIVRGGAPSIDVEDVRLCPVCNGSEFSRLAVGFDYELRTCSNPWRFVRCAGCGHAWLNPRPAVSELGTIYPRNYYAYDYENTIHPIAVRGKAALDQLKLGSIVRALGRTPDSYMDIGCGTGRFLRAMARRGVARKACHGLDIDAKPLQSLSDDGFAVHCGRVEACADVEPCSLELATMFHVIEHVADPGQVMATVRDWLVPGGLFAVETPNLESWDARLFRERYWGGYHIPRHWHVFTHEVANRTASSAWPRPSLPVLGLDLVSMKWQTGHSFWMYSFHHLIRYWGCNTPRPGAMVRSLPEPAGADDVYAL